MEAWLELCDLHLQELDYQRAAFCMEELLLSNPYNHLIHQKYAEVSLMNLCCLAWLIDSCISKAVLENCVIKESIQCFVSLVIFILLSHIFWQAFTDSYASNNCVKTSINIMHCILLAIFSRLSQFPFPSAVSANWPFCVDLLLNIQLVNQSNIASKQPIMSILLKLIKVNVC